MSFLFLVRVKCLSSTFLQENKDRHSRKAYGLLTVESFFL